MAEHRKTINLSFVLDIQHIRINVGKGAMVMQQTTDPRILRTRQLIMDTFVELSSQKEFKQITVKDITESAQINRSTFYYHFEDIYDLLDKALTEFLSVNLSYGDYKDKIISEESLTKLFVAITTFQISLSHRCHRGYEDTIARIIREQLEVIILKMLENQFPENELLGLMRTAKILSWGLYGISSEWRKNNEETTPESFIKPALPYLLNINAKHTDSTSD